LIPSSVGVAPRQFHLRFRAGLTPPVDKAPWQTERPYRALYLKNRADFGLGAVNHSISNDYDNFLRIGVNVLKNVSAYFLSIYWR
jgi:hypothetical protein